MRMMRGMAVTWACSALFAATACHAQAKDEPSFAAEMIAQLKQRVPGLEIVGQDENDPLAVRVTGGEWQEATINFHRIYGYCQNASPAECKTTRDEFLDKILKRPAAAGITASSLRLAVRDAQYVDYVRRLDAAKSMLVAEPIGDDLFAILVSDSPDTLTLVSPEELAKLGMTRKQAWARAWQLTRAGLPTLPDGAALAKSAVAYQDQGYLASLLIDTKAWRAIADKAGPEMFVTVVADNFVFVGRMPDGPRLEKFRQTVREDCESQQRCVSPNLYRFRDGRWVVSR